MSGVDASRAAMPPAAQGAGMTRVAADAGGSDARSFADWLALRDDAPDARPFADGTMRADATAFDAAGLFAPATPGRSGGPASAGAEDLGGVGVEVDAARAVAARGPSPIAGGVGVAGASIAAPCDVPGARPMGMAMAMPGGVPVSLVPPQAVAAPVPMPLVDMLPIVTGETPVAEPARAARLAAARRDGASAATGLRVALEAADEDGSVEVAVSGDFAVDDEAALHRDVTRLLARHGLVLAALRITDRGGGGQQRERR